MNKNLKELLDEKGFYQLGKDFKESDWHPDKAPHFSYDLKETIFQEYRIKFNELYKEYQSKLKELNIYPTNGELDRGRKLATAYPKLLEQAKAKVWEKLENVVVGVLNPDTREF